MSHYYEGRAICSRCKCDFPIAAWREGWPITCPRCAVRYRCVAGSFLHVASGARLSLLEWRSEASNETNL